MKTEITWFKSSEHPPPKDGSEIIALWGHAMYIVDYTDPPGAWYEGDLPIGPEDPEWWAHLPMTPADIIETRQNREKLAESVDLVQTATKEQVEKAQVRFGEWSREHPENSKALGDVGRLMMYETLLREVMEEDSDS